MHVPYLYFKPLGLGIFYIIGEKAAHNEYRRIIFGHCHGLSHQHYHGTASVLLGSEGTDLCCPYRAVHNSGLVLMDPRGTIHKWFLGRAWDTRAFSSRRPVLQSTSQFPQILKRFS
jgi:hypothetical protein